MEGLFVEVNATELEKCERCWHHTSDVGTIAGHTHIVDVVFQMSMVMANFVSLYNLTGHTR
ncbi:zinc finger domain-containing protein [Vibrio sp. PP-XX7]